MIESMNKNVDLVIAGTSYLFLASYGKIHVGDRAFEFYNDKNKKDYIQIPWSEISYISASVLFGKYINRFAIFLKNGQHLTFSSKNNKKVLKAVNKYIASDKLLRSYSFFEVIYKGIKGLFKRN